MEEREFDDAVILIPARAGSTRIRGENLQPLCGKPLLGSIVQTAWCVTRLFTDTYGKVLCAKAGNWTQTFDPERCTGWEISSNEVFDLDTESDFERAKLLFIGRNA